MRDPDPAELDHVLALGDGAIRMVTLAPERVGALAAVRRIVDAGAVAAVGHTEATYEQTQSAIAAGAPHPWARTCSTRCRRSTTATPDQ